MRATERIHEYGRLAAILKERKDKDTASTIAAMCVEDLQPRESAGRRINWIEGRACDYIRTIATYLRPLPDSTPEALRAQAGDILEHVKFFEVCEQSERAAIGDEEMPTYFPGVASRCPQERRIRFYLCHGTQALTRRRCHSTPARGFAISGPVNIARQRRGGICPVGRLAPDVRDQLPVPIKSRHERGQYQRRAFKKVPILNRRIPSTRIPDTRGRRFSIDEQVFQGLCSPLLRLAIILSTIDMRRRNRRAKC